MQPKIGKEVPGKTIHWALSLAPVRSSSQIGGTSGGRLSSFRSSTVELVRPG